MAKLSLSAYAAHRGVSPAAVTKAVRTGRIATETDPQTGRRVIDPETADRQWDANTDRAKQEGSLAHQLQRRDGAPPKDLQLNGEPTTAALGAPPPLSESNPSPTAALALSKARREHYNAEMARLAFEQKVGKLVDVDEVKRQAFAIARVVRESMFNIPDRLSSTLAGETDARRIHELLTDEITKALEAVADVADDAAEEVAAG